MFYDTYYENAIRDLADHLAQLNIARNPISSFKSAEQNTFHEWDRDFAFNGHNDDGHYRDEMTHCRPFPGETFQQATVRRDGRALKEELGDLMIDFQPKPPPKNYVCYICYKTGHYIQYCPKAPVEKLTPYQGAKRCFGKFTCPKCKRSWKSAKSYAEIGQQCNKCKVTVFPKKQFALEKRKPTDSMSSSMSSSFD